jgi:exo-beta-1,3-glucanase (GH17 family)
VIQDVVNTRQTLDSHGDLATPIDITEVGWPTQGLSGRSGPPSISDNRRASYLSTVTNTLMTSNCDIERITPYAWVTLEQSPLNQEDWYGIVHHTGQLTATGVAYGNTIRRLESSTPAQATVCNRP